MNRRLINLRWAYILFFIISCHWLSVCKAAEQSQNSVSIVFAGDVMLDGGPGHTIVHGGDPFAEFAGIFQKADIAVCNLECVVAGGGEQVLKNYTFRGPRQSIPLLKKYFTAVSLANNHTGDFGPDAFLEQLKLLNKAEIAYFGGGRNIEEANRPLMLKRNGLQIALLAFNRFPPKAFMAGENKPGTAWLEEAEVIKAIKSSREVHHADIVVPYLHWGQEMEPSPTIEQKELARRLIDAGADAIIGNHAHVTQTVDVYKGRPIVYSLGNTVFDYYPVDPEVFTGWIVKLSFTKQPDKTAEADLETFVLTIDKTGIPHLLPAEETK